MTKDAMAGIALQKHSISGSIESTHLREQSTVGEPCLSFLVRLGMTIAVVMTNGVVRTMTIGKIFFSKPPNGELL
jgi:hypothetical protein